MKVLIVDDNVAVQEIRNILVERSHNVCTASMVYETVEKIRSFEPDIIMLNSWVDN